MGSKAFHRDVERGNEVWRAAPNGSTGRDRRGYSREPDTQFMFEEILAGIAQALGRRGLPYMIVGGQAVLLYGEPRLTRDIDVTLGVATEHLGELLAVLEELCLRPIPEDAGWFVERTMVLPASHEATGVRVDFIFSFTSYELNAIGRARKVRVLDQEVHFASPEDLIIHKIFAGRPRDLEDVRAIVLKNPGLDFAYIKTWLKDFDSFLEKNEFVRAFETILQTIDS